MQTWFSLGLGMSICRKIPWLLFDFVLYVCLELGGCGEIMEHAEGGVDIKLHVVLHQMMFLKRSVKNATQEFERVNTELSHLAIPPIFL